MSLNFLTFLFLIKTWFLIKTCFVVLEEPLRVFHHFFFRGFYFNINFDHCFLVFSLLIALVHFTNFRVFHYCLFKCFYFTTDFYYCFSSVFISSTFFTMTVFLPGTSFFYRECYGFERAFLLSGVFYLALLPDIWHNLLLPRLPWEPAVLP